MRIAVNATFALLLLVSMIVAFHTVFVTQNILDKVSSLESKIAEKAGAISLLEAEWSYLNGAERLTSLVREYKGELRLIEITPDSLRQLGDVPTRSQPEPEKLVEETIARDLVEAFP